MPRQMGRGRAGGPGPPAHLGGKLGQEPVIIPHLTGAEQPAWARPLRRDVAEVKLLPNCSVKMMLGD